MAPCREVRGASSTDAPLHPREIRKVFGPYAHKRTGRNQVKIYYSDGTRKTTNYARYLMEQHLGRYLLDEEHVDHINGDFTDDRLENLQILTNQDNLKKRYNDDPSQQALWITVECAYCKREFQKKEHEYYRNQVLKEMRGPFCSIRCSKRKPRKKRTTI